MTYQELCEKFFFNKGAVNIQFSAGDFFFRMVKIPIVDGLWAVYYHDDFESRKNPEKFHCPAFPRSDMRLLAFVAHDGIIIAGIIPSALHTNVEGWPDERAEGVYAAKILEAAETILNKEDPDLTIAPDPLYNVFEDAARIFFGEKPKKEDPLREATLLTEISGDDFVHLVLALPDYTKAAKVWLGIGENRKRLALSLKAAREAERLAKMWESLPTSSIFKLRTIRRATDGMKKVEAILQGPDGVVTAQLPTRSFVYAARDDGIMTYVSLWAIESAKEREKVFKQMGNDHQPPIYSVLELRYRGKTIYQASDAPAK